MIGFNKAEIEGDIGRRFRRVAHALPRQAAVKTPGGAITYADLDSQSDEIALSIVSRRGPAEEPVALLIEQGITSLTALLGIVKAGKSIVLLPPEFPKDRLTTIWLDAGKPLVIADRTSRSLANSLVESPLQLLDLNEPSDRAADVGSSGPGPDALAAIFYTSATTGEPKGVLWSHRMVLHTAWQNQERYKISAADRMAHLSAYGFGAAMTTSFAALLNGATLHLRDDATNDFKIMVDWLRQEQVTILGVTTLGLFRQQVEAMTQSVSLPHLRLVLLGGEELYRQDIDQFRRVFPASTDFSYRLAGSEIMLVRELRIRSKTKIAGDKVPVGYAVQDKDVLLWDENRKAVPAGEVGEIAVRSRYLASGYWKQPEQTKKTFLPDPEGGDGKIFLSGDLGRLTSDNQLEYLGRKDNMVKVRGFRIQLEAIEIALLRIPNIREVAVVAISLSRGDKRLAAYIVPGAEGSLSVEDLRYGLADKLPRYMIPSVFVFLERLPRTATGKVDRPSLPPPGNTRPPLKTQFVEARTELEKGLCKIWAEVLRLDKIGVEDDFFDLGGDSLMALHLIFLAEETYHKQVPSVFFRQPTVAHLGQLWQSGQAEQSGDSIPLPQRSAETRRKRMPFYKTPLRGKGKKGGIRRVFEDRARTAGFIVRFLAADLAIRRPYMQGNRLVAWICSQPIGAGFFFRPQADSFRRFIRNLGGCPDAPADAVNIYLMGNILWSRHALKALPYASGNYFIDVLRHSKYPYWSGLAEIIEKTPPEELDRYFSVSGLEHIAQAYQKGHGVIIVTYHNTANRIAMAALPRRLNCAPIPTIAKQRALQLEQLRKRENPDELPSAEEAALISDLAVQGQRLLKQGGIIQIVPDSSMDVLGDRPLIIGKREYYLKPGFAELALHTGAAVVPQYTTRRLDGSIHTAFQPPMDPLAEGEDHETQIYSLLKQYADFVDRSWHLAPESLKYAVIEKYLHQPMADGST
jgi:amino acid adenylation domain-containing protein